ncbi:hypothetical protein BVE84_05080 [Streptococcus azizii]|uniref:N-acetyltransferase domain-containing protein n=1 Tax=Streptococcus azizii TaxID=1579424 RepID=A0AB36JQG8_9STRE|nr:MULTISPECIES: GNAT family N-acetyltransferase [Streptococcus]MBF0775880.1 GNAT family N-acetyltransferase [Streptococcus sp. 19428wD3_AN2]ONK27463.1 hypothetical protein BVE86_04920 [Streptococcus azizii]ONK28700.1 hypothetical protein BVE85_04225 [Streptococcus azizii]ONK29396.1 hypothetical protein BVE84_05080 [Streptococcus azizii]TFU83930.1 GNAT family N-acetyltransferase [Streptococcus sp. AN2]
MVGELYTIEIRGQEGWKAIEDVSLSPDGLPTVIGEVTYRGQGIGKRVIQVLIVKAQSQGYSMLGVREIDKENHALQKCFMVCGFRPNAPIEKGTSYCRRY